MKKNEFTRAELDKVVATIEADIRHANAEEATSAAQNLHGNARGATRWRENRLRGFDWKSVSLRLIYWPGHEAFNRHAAGERD